MRILRLTPYFYFGKPPDGKWNLLFEPLGGMQVQITEQTRGIDVLGHEQVVVTVGLPGLARDFLWTPNTRMHSVRLPTLPLKDEAKGTIGLLVSWGLGSIWWSLKQRRRPTGPAVDVVHCHCSELPWTFLAGLVVAKLLRRPLVVTIHCSALFTSHAAKWQEVLSQALAQRAEKLALAKAEHVIVLTERMRQCCLEGGLVEPQRISVIPDGVDCDRFAGALPEHVAHFRAAHQLPAEQHVVAYVGRIAPEKGWQTLVEAAHLLQDRPIAFLICGDGHQRAQFEAAVLRKGLGSRFHFSGFLPHEQIPAAMRCARVIALPSIHEELGGTILEAMACHVPIVASRTGGIPHVIKHGENGLLFSPGSAEELAQAICTVLDNPVLAQQLCSNAMAEVVEDFAIDRICRRLLAIYGKSTIRTHPEEVARR